jgi:hypothetical protein
MSAPAANSRTPAVATAKDYTGRYVVPHPVQRGETLEKIAAAYRFKHWKPIWIYNSEIQKTVGPDPNVIRHGVTIFIPRSPEGYDRVIRMLKASEEAMLSSLDELHFAQEKLAFERKASAVVWNFAGDVAQLGVGLSVKALAALKATKAAKHAIGQAKVAAQLSSNAQTREWAEQYAKARNRLTREALAADKAARASKAGVQTFIKDKTVDAGARAADHVRNTATGNDEGRLFQDAKNAAKLMKLSKELVEQTASMGEASVEFVLTALDYLNVDAASDWLVSVLISGERFDEIQKRTKSNAAKTAERLFEHVEKRIETLTEERHLLYGSAR